MLAILMNTMRFRRQKKAKIHKQNVELVCCRTCLSTEDLHPIFYDKGNARKRSEDLRLVTGLEITYLDGLPQDICSKCVESMNEALKYRRTSVKANETLLSMGFQKASSKCTESVNTNILVAKRIAKPLGNTQYNAINDEDFSYENYEDDQTNHFDDIRKIQRYSKVLKANKDVAPFKCNMCNKEFRMKSTYRAHLRFHTNFCVCELCGKKCRNNNLLLLHKRGRHGMERIHKCSFCNYSAANKEGLIIHERRHTGEKPYVCDHCGASFHRRSNLVQHIAIHLPDKNFQCDVCSKRVKSRKFLQIHKHNAHTGRRYAYLCAFCARRFEKPNKVRAHMRSAHGAVAAEIKRVECEHCQKRFHSKKFLQSHKFKTHQGRRYTYVCHVCKAHFTTTDSTRKHLTRAHGVARATQGPVYRIPNPQLKHRVVKVN